MQLKNHYAIVYLTYFYSKLLFSFIIVHFELSKIVFRVIGNYISDNCNKYVLDRQISSLYKTIIYIYM